MCKIKNAAAGTAAGQIKLRSLKYSTSFNLSTTKLRKFSQSRKKVGYRSANRWRAAS